MERITCIPARHASAALALAERAERAERQRSGAATWKVTWMGDGWWFFLRKH